MKWLKSVTPPSTARQNICLNMRDVCIIVGTENNTIWLKTFWHMNQISYLIAIDNIDHASLDHRLDV